MPGAPIAPSSYDPEAAGVPGGGRRCLTGGSDRRTPAEANGLRLRGSNRETSLRSWSALTARDTSRVIVLPDTSASGVCYSDLATGISRINEALPPDLQSANLSKCRRPFGGMAAAACRSFVRSDDPAGFEPATYGSRSTRQ